jgi:hypothetical protein
MIPSISATRASLEVVVKGMSAAVSHWSHSAELIESSRLSFSYSSGSVCARCRMPGPKLRRCQVLYFCTRKASTLSFCQSLESMHARCHMPGPQRPRCQCLYFCTSKANKLRVPGSDTAGARQRTRRTSLWHAPPQASVFVLLY